MMVNMHDDIYELVRKCTLIYKSKIEIKDPLDEIATDHHLKKKARDLLKQFRAGYFKK